MPDGTRGTPCRSGDCAAGRPPAWSRFPEAASKSRAYGHAVLSHRSAAELWGLLKGCSRPIQVSVPKQRVDSRKGIRAHATTTLLTKDVTRRKGISVTTVARTLLDLAESEPEHIFWKAFEQAEIDKLLKRHELDDVLARATGRRGQRLLAAAVRTSDPLSKQLKSKLERRFLRLLREANLPIPLVNEPLTLPNGNTIYPDFHWPEHKLILETDGRETHLTGSAFERDRRRDQQLTLMGYRCPRAPPGCSWTRRWRLWWGWWRG